MAARRNTLSADDLDELMPELLNNDDEWPLSVFPADTIEWAVGYGSHLGCHPVVLMLPLLATIAGLIGTTGAMEWAGGIVAVPIFAMVCAPSGSRKSAAYNVISRALSQLERGVNTAAADAANANDLGANNAGARRGAASPQRFAFGGGSFPALRQRLEAQPDGRRSMVVLYEEAVSLFSWMGGLAHDQRAHDLDMATLLVLYDGHPWARELVGNAAAAGPARADDLDQADGDGPSTGVSIATFSQPATMLVQLGKSDQLGFWARWEIAIVGRCHIPDVAQRGHFEPAVTVAALLQTVYNAHRGRDLKRYTMDEEATGEFHRLFQQVEDQLQAFNGANEPEARVLGKLQGKILKLSVIVHVFLHAMAGTEDIPLVIGASAVRIADALVHYHAATQIRARHLFVRFRDARNDAQAGNARAGDGGRANPVQQPVRIANGGMRAISQEWRDAAAALRQRGSFLTPRMIMQRAPHCRTAAAAVAVLQQLERQGLLTHEQHSRRWIKARFPNDDVVLPNQRDGLHRMGISVADYVAAARPVYLNGH